MVLISNTKSDLLDAGISKFLSTMDEKYEFVVFDLETNGLDPKKDSVLSISAMKVRIRSKNNLVCRAMYNRYYYPVDGEDYNPYAIAINGLTEEVITKKREGATYPEHFKDDIDAFKEYCGDCHHFMGHNLIHFDTQFFDGKVDFASVFDTLVENTPIVDSANEFGQGKAPRLSECAEFYGINPDGPLHQSFWDTMLTAKVFQEMLGNSTLRLAKDKCVQ